MIRQWNGTILWQIDSCREAIENGNEKTLAISTSKLGENLINVLHMAEDNLGVKTFYYIKLAAKKYAAEGILSKDYSDILEWAYNIYKGVWYVDLEEYDVSFEDLEENFLEIEELFNEVEAHLHNKGII